MRHNPGVLLRMAQDADALGRQGSGDKQVVLARKGG